MSAQLNENIHVLHEDVEFPDIAGVDDDIEASIIGITGAMGGVGVTTLAIQLAYYLAQMKSSRQPKIALISLDFENSAISQYLDVEPKVTLEDFKQEPSIIDEPFVERAMRQTPFGFHALSLPNILGGNDNVNPDTVLSFLDITSRQFDYIILDIPRLWAPWTHAALGTADKVVMVSELSVPGLRIASQRREALLQMVEELCDIDFILNKVERRSFRNSLKLSDAERAFGTSYVPSLPMNSDKIREAINRGEPIGAATKECRFVREANELFSEWVTTMTARRERESTAFATHY